MKSHRLCGLVGRSHELPNRRDELPDRVVMPGEFAFELVELASQLFVCQHGLLSLTNARTTNTLTSTARGEFNSPAAMNAPCSEKA